MTAMEKMVANMLGFTPEQMHATLQGFSEMVSSTKDTLERIERKLDAITASQLEVNEHGNGNNRDDNSR